MKIKLPVIYSQFDPAWKSKLLGFNTDSKYDFNNYGCLVTSLADVVSYFGHTDTPAELNDKLKDLGENLGFQKGTGNYVHGAISKLYPDITEKVTHTPAALTDDQIKEIKTALDNGNVVIFGLDYNPKTLEYDSHFSAVVDYNPNDENDFTLADPLGGSTHSLKSYLGFFKPSARKSIESYLIYSGPQAAQPTEVKEEPAPVQEVPQAPQANQLPPNYGDIVHNSVQWQATHLYLELDKTPEQSTFEDAKRVIAGLKSAKTDYNNKRIETEKTVARQMVEITNYKEEVGRLVNELATNEKLKKAEIDALKNNKPDFETYRKQAEGIIEELKGQLRSKVNEAKDLRIEVEHSKVESGLPIDLESLSVATTKGNKNALAAVASGVLSVLKGFIVIKS